MDRTRRTGQNTELRKIVVVFKTHFDLGFTDLPDEVMTSYTGPMFEAVQRIIEATSSQPHAFHYRWTLPAWPLKQLLHDPELPEETKRAAARLVKEGRLIWHAWPFTIHTAFCGIEELVRGMHISRSLSEEFGIWPISAKQTDVPGHTWILPTLLARAGVTFLHLGCNAGSHPPHVPRIFWWEGPDGSKTLTYYSAGEYGTPLLPTDDWDLGVWLSIQHTLDNAGAHSLEDLGRIRAAIEQGAPGVNVMFGDLDDFARALFEQPEQLEALPVIPYDLADTWIHGIGTMPREVARVRALRGKLLRLEAIAACFGWPAHSQASDRNSLDFPLARQIAPHLDEAYKQLLLFGEHTWGLDVKSTIVRAFGEQFRTARQSEPYQRLESSWRAKAEYVNRAEGAYARARETVRAEWRTWLASPEVQEAHARAAEYPGQEPSLKAEATPELAYATAPSSLTVIEQSGARIEIDPTLGGIVSWQDRWTGREWVDSATAEPFGGLRYDLYSAADIAGFLRAYGRLFQEWFVHDFGKQGYPEHTPHVTAYARNFDVSRAVDGSSLLLTGGTLQATGPGAEFLPPQRVSIKIAVWGGPSPSINLDYTIEGKEATHFAESTVVPFSLSLPKATFRLGQTGSVIDPARDIVAGANRSLWCADWVDVSDERVGMTVVPVDMPLVSIGNTGIYAFEPERVPEVPVVYAHLSNTQWGTNFPQWLEGDFTFSVSLVPHSGDWRTGQVWKHVQLADLRDLHLEEESGVCDLTGALELPEGLVLQAMRPRHDAPGLVVRYWDAMGIGRFEKLKVSGAATNVWRCDLMERPVEKLNVKREENQLQMWLEVRPHAIETLLIEFYPSEDDTP